MIDKFKNFYKQISCYVGFHYWFYSNYSYKSVSIDLRMLLYDNGFCGQPRRTCNKCNKQQVAQLLIYKNKTSFHWVDVYNEYDWQNPLDFIYLQNRGNYVT